MLNNLTVDHYDGMRAVKVGDKSTCMDIGESSVRFNGEIYTTVGLNVGGTVIDSNFRKIINTGWYASVSTKIYMPLNGYIIEKTSTTSSNEYLAFICPYDGEVEQVICRSEAACGSTIVGVHLSSNGVEVPSATASYTVTENMAVDDTSYKFAFDSATFSAGQVMAISFDPTSISYDTNATIVLKFDLKKGL